MDNEHHQLLKERLEIINKYIVDCAAHNETLRLLWTWDELLHDEMRKAIVSHIQSQSYISAATDEEGITVTVYAKTDCLRSLLHDRRTT